jgi:integration host factor subunit beta
MLFLFRTKRMTDSASSTPTSQLVETSITRSELVDLLAEQFPQLLPKDVELAVRTLLDTMTSSLSKGKRIELRGVGSFVLHQRPARVGRNPKSGEQVLIPEKKVPHFKPGKELRERVDYKAKPVKDGQSE